MTWLIGKHRELKGIHKDLEPELLSEIATSLREVAAQSMFGSAALVVSPGSKKSIGYLTNLTRLKEKLEGIQTNPCALRTLQEELREMQMEFGDWQRKQTEELVSDFTESIGQIVSFCESSLSSQDVTTDHLSGMQNRLAQARDCNDIVQVRQMLKTEVIETQKLIEVHRATQASASQEFSGLVKSLEQRIQKAEEASQTDHLTSLGNRAAFQFYAEATLQKVRNGEGPYSIATFDLDGFKPINDTYGHAIGDLALNAFAGRLKGAFPRPYFVGRTGGDEFVVVASLSLKELNRRCEKLSRDLLRHPFSLDQAGNKTEIKLGVSYGASSVSDELTIEGVCLSSDRLMFEQKKSKKVA